MPNTYYDSPFYNMGLSQEPVQPQQMVQPTVNNGPRPYRPQNMQPPVPESAELTSGGFSFTIRDDDAPAHDLPADSTAPEEQKRKRGRPRKDKTTSLASDVGQNKDNDGPMPTMYTYQETTNMLRGTLAQIDQLAGQVKSELDNVQASRTLKSKYNVMVGLSGNLSDILGQKISVIKEINNAISKSNEMDYKREKDRQSVEAGMNDDKYLMDMYNAFIQNPANNASNNPLGPNTMMVSIGSDMGNGGQQVSTDAGYLGYVANMTPEQRLMSVEDDPNTKQCLIYDAMTGNKAFQWMNMATGQPINGLPTRDPMFLEDTTIDLRNKVAKNINLNETYPVVVINENVIDEY